MEHTLSKKEYYEKVTPKKSKSMLICWIIALVINVIGLLLGPASILGIIACLVCWFGGKANCNKWWGVVLSVCGAVQWILIYVIGGVVPFIEIIVGIYIYQTYNNLDKAYAEYLEKGVMPDVTGY